MGARAVNWFPTEKVGFSLLTEAVITAALTMVAPTAEVVFSVLQVHRMAAFGKVCGSKTAVLGLSRSGMQRVSFGWSGMTTQVRKWLAREPRHPEIHRRMATLCRQPRYPKLQRHAPGVAGAS